MSIATVLDRKIVRGRPLAPILRERHDPIPDIVQGMAGHVIKKPKISPKRAYVPCETATRVRGRAAASFVRLTRFAPCSSVRPLHDGHSQSTTIVGDCHSLHPRKEAGDAVLIQDFQTKPHR